MGPPKGHELSESELPRQVENPGARQTDERRNCLRALVALLGVAGTRSLPGYLEQSLRRIGENLMGDDVALSQLGALYLASHPEERDSKTLSRLLVRNQTIPLRPALIANIARDWAAHDVAVLDGWILSRTEGRLCALLHLTHGRRA